MHVGADVPVAAAGRSIRVHVPRAEAPTVLSGRNIPFPKLHYTGTSYNPIAPSTGLLSTVAISRRALNQFLKIVGALNSGGFEVHPLVSIARAQAVRNIL